MTIFIAMRKIVFALAVLCINVASFAQNMVSVFETSNGARSATYRQAVNWYRQLDKKYDKIHMEEAGPTNTPYPLHVVYYNNAGNFNISDWKAKGNLILLINNGIHPGEPDGIDASMMMLRDIASGKIHIPDNIMLAVIPVFNIGGALNRNSCSRANQNGPEAYGFRGNSQNLDLNRDFIKMDAKETQSLVKLIHHLDPEIFLDNHVSNGADYQHVMTLLATLHDKLGGTMGKYMNETFIPLLYKDMKQRDYDLVPYVNHWGHTPDKGWIAFHDGPRFASGFTSLFQIYGFVSETHMLKPFKQRVAATYALMLSMIKTTAENAADIQRTRMQDRLAIQNASSLAIEWQADTTRPSTITFKGYEAGYKPSEVSGFPRLYYDRSKPYTKKIPFWDAYTVKQEVACPKAYVIGSGWRRVISRLKTNGVKMYPLQRDTDMVVRIYYIENFETGNRPYEGHYLHTAVKVRPETRTIHLLKGDYIIPVQQPAKRYLMETLEPTAPDAFLAWGFFDAILQQKEYFSDYVFEDEAAAILKKDAALKALLEEKVKTDTAFAHSGAAQLDFVYRHSCHYESVHMRYPVFRIE